MTADDDIVEVVVVDDHEMVRDALARVLSDQPDIVVVGTAASARETFQLLEAIEPDVLVIDYQLPDINGVEVVRRLAGTHPSVKSVMVTGSGDNDEVTRAAMYAGCSGLVEKTRAIEDLVDTVRRAARGEAVIRRDQLAGLAGRGLAPPIDLTPREREVLLLMAEGRSTRDTAETLGLTLDSVRNYSQRLITKLGAHSKIEAVVIARRRGLL